MHATFIKCRYIQCTCTNGPLGEVPESNTAVLRVADNQFLSRMEDDAGYIIVVTSTCINFPCLGIYTMRHTPYILVCMYMYMICIHTAQYTGSVWSDKCFIYMTLLNWNMHTHGHNHQPFILHNLICLSSAADTSSGRVGWKDTQLTPRSWPWQGRNTYICTRWNNIHIVNLNLQYTWHIEPAVSPTSPKCIHVHLLWFAIIHDIHVHVHNYTNTQSMDTNLQHMFDNGICTAKQISGTRAP